MDNNTQAVFMDALNNLKEYAAVNGQTVDKSDVINYFKDIELDDKKMDIIYGYLMANNIRVKGEELKNNKFAKIVNESREAEKKTDEEVNVKKIVEDLADYSQDETSVSDYKAEVDGFGNISREEVVSIISEIPQDDENVPDKMMYYFMGKIAYWIEPFMKKGICAADLIQEANLSLLAYLKSKRWQNNDEIQKKAESGEKSALEDVFDYIEDEIADDIRGSLSILVDDQFELAKVSNKILEKVNFVNDWAKRLKTELDRKPTIDELSEKTGLPREEIIDAINFSADNIEDINSKQ